MGEDDWRRENEARLRMTRIPKGAELILNKVSGAPGFWIGNVIVMAGVPLIMQAMLDEVAPKLKIGVRMFSETVRADAREGAILRSAARAQSASMPRDNIEQPSFLHGVLA
jgi:molybdopterin-biosynthesis enzyme MoeA-like protein